MLSDLLAIAVQQSTFFGRQARLALVGNLFQDLVGLDLQFRISPGRMNFQSRPGLEPTALEQTTQTLNPHPSQVPAKIGVGRPESQAGEVSLVGDYAFRFERSPYVSCHHEGPQCPGRHRQDEEQQDLLLRIHENKQHQYRRDGPRGANARTGVAPKPHDDKRDA